MPEQKHKILFLQEKSQDVESIIEGIEESGVAFSVKKVCDKNSFIHAVETYSPDLILADYNSSEYNAFSALQNVRENSNYIPFIIIIDTVHEEDVVKYLKAGVDDIIFKDSMVRLGSAIKAVTEKRRILSEKVTADRTLRESEEKLRLLIDNVTDLIVKVDADGRFVFVSKSYCELFGQSEEELLGKHFMPLVHEEDHRVTERAMLDLKQPPYTCYIEQRAMTKYGWRWIAWTDKAIFNERGEIEAIIGAGRDITDRKIYEEVLTESEERYKSLFENNHTVILLIDLKNEAIIDANPAACTFYGYTRQQMQSMNMADLSIKSSKESPAERQKSYQRRQKQRIIKHKRANGEIRDVEVLTGPITISGKQLLYSIINDITERRKVEEALEKSYDFYLTLFEKFPGMIWRSDMQGEINYVNHSLLQFTGRGFTDELGRKWLTIVHPDDRESVEKVQYEYIAERKPFQMEYRLRHHTGQYRWIIDIGKPYENIEGDYAGYVGMCFDITDRKESEARIHRVNRLYSMLSMVNQAILETNDSLALFNTICKVAVEEGGLKLAWIGMYDSAVNRLQIVSRYGQGENYPDLLDLSLHGEERRYPPALISLISGKYYIVNSIKNEASLADQDEAVFNGNLRAEAVFPLRSENAVAGVFCLCVDKEDFFGDEEIHLLEDIAKDISFALQKMKDDETRKNAELSLQVSEERFRTLVQSMDDIVFVLDNEQRYVGVYGRWLEILGLSENLFIGKTIREMLGTELSAEHEIANNRALSGEHVIYSWIAHTPGGNRYMQTSLSPLRNSSGEITGIVGVGRDVTELREAQKVQQVVQSVALDSAANAVVITDPDGIIQYVNSAFTTLTGYGKAEVIGEKPKILKSGKHDELYYRNIWETIQNGNVWSGEIINRKKDGRLYTEEMTITPVRNQLGTITHFIAIKQDITNQKQIQQHLFQTQKMESIGTLASGIAHDFNNILGIILGYTSLIEKNNNDNDNESLSRNIQVINQTVNRGAKLVQQILTFARKTELTLDVVDVNSVISELAKMLEETFPKTITMHLELAPHVPVLLIDQGQLHQVLLNLCVNARDAIQTTKTDTGTITIKSAVVPGTQLQSQYDDAGSDNYLNISVSDTGTGMDEKTIERIFEPFYTTKEMGKGTGLGLSVVYGIVKSYQGYIDVKSSRGSGTEFSIYLPVHFATDEQAVKGTFGHDDIRGGNETILLIEDESFLLEAVQTILEEKGYKVYTAVDGLSAIDIYSKHCDTIDLVVSDIGLPNMSGTEVLKELYKINRDIPFMLASGYFDPLKKKKIAEYGVKAFVNKPYQLNELLITVRKILDH